MKFIARSAAWLLPLVLTAGCIHKSQLAQNQPLAPPIEDAPPPKPEPAPTNLPAPEVSVPVQPQPKPVAPPPEPVKKPARHKKQPATNNPQVASSGTPAVSAIGQLTTNDPPNMRQQTDASIASTEKSLNSITRKLDDQEEKTADHIREFLKKAREALTAGDVDGANNLAIKAKALLDELHP